MMPCLARDPILFPRCLLAMSQEHLIRCIMSLLSIRIPDPLQECLKLLLLTFRHLDAGKDLRLITAIVPIVEEADILTWRQSSQESVKCAGSLWELEAVESLVRCCRDTTTNQISDVRLCYLVL